MKKFTTIIAILLALGAASQPITDTGALRSYINTVIIPNGTRAITGLQMNRVLNGFLTSEAPLWRQRVDSIWKVGTVLYFRKGGITYSLLLPSGSDSSLFATLYRLDTAKANIRGQIPGLARAAISLTTTGTSGAATYNNGTGVLNVPEYSALSINNFIKFDSVSKSIYSSNSIGNGGSSANIYNIAIGDSAGASLTSGNNNIIFGKAALKNTTVYNYNVAIGQRALSNLTNNPTYSNSQSGNVAIGAFALQNMTEGDNNSDVGRNNVAIGAFALNNLVRGTKNIAIGYNAGNSIVNGRSNVIIGARTAGDNDGNFVVRDWGASILTLPGSLICIKCENTAPGFRTVAINSNGGTGSDNISIGAESQQNTTGARSIGIGYRANRVSNNFTGSGADNLAIGYESQSPGTGGETVNRTGGRNLSIGNFSMSQISGAAANNIAIGYGMQNMFSNTGSRQVLIGYNDTAYFAKGQNHNYIINAAGIATPSLSLNQSASLEVNGINGGILPPRLTTSQRNTNIPSPATGLFIYCTDCTAIDGSTGVMQTWNGSTWKSHW